MLYELANTSLDLKNYRLTDVRFTLIENIDRINKKFQQDWKDWADERITFGNNREIRRRLNNVWNSKIKQLSWISILEEIDCNNESINFLISKISKKQKQ